MLLALSSFSAAAQAQEYYRGKTISIFARRRPGGGIDSEMRLIAHHLALQIRGKPDCTHLCPYVVAQGSKCRTRHTSKCHT
jgi:hypothetical protein